MSKEAVQLSLPGFEQAHGRWRAEYGRQIGAERAIRNRSQIEIKPLYTPRDWNGESFLETARLSRPIPLHPRHLSDHAPRPHLDAAPVDRPGHARRLQQARARYSRRRRHRDQPLAVQFRLSRRGLRRGRSGSARHLRHRDQHHRSHGPGARRRAARRHLRRDERSVAVHVARLHARRRQAARHSVDVDHRHLEPERLHLAFHRQSHVLPAVAARRAARPARPYRVLPQARAGLESGVGRRSAHAAGRRDAGRDHGLHHLDRAPICARLHRSRHGHRRRAAAFHFLLRHIDQLLRGGRQIPRRPAHLGAAGARTARRQGAGLVALQIPRPDLRRRSHRAAAAQQYRARRGAGHGWHHERTAILAHRRLRRSDHHADRGDRAHRGGHAEHPARGGASVRRHRPARRLLLRRDADRPDGTRRSRR